MSYCVYDNDGNIVSYFRPEVQAVVDVYTNGDVKSERNVRLRLYFDDDQYSDEFQMSLSQLGKFDWLSQDQRCRFNPEVSSIKGKRFLEDAVRKALPTAPVEKQYRLNRLGCHVIEGVPVFNVGGGLLWPPLLHQRKRPDVIAGPSLFNLDIDPNITEANALAGMFELISLCPNAGRVIIVQVLLYIMRSVYTEAWKSPCVCLFLYGKTHLKKTSFSALMTQMHNFAGGITSLPRLNASISAAVKIILEKSDCVVVLDDLFPADSKEIRQKQEQTLSEITRFIGDGIAPARMRGNKVSKETPTCGVLFTGEYLIGTGSDAARLLPVEMTPPDLEGLRKFQTQPLIVSTFYHFFIQWFLENYDDIVELLRAWSKAYLQTRIVAHDRLNETHFFLNTAYVMFLQYCYDKSFLSEQDVKRLHGSFVKLLTHLIRAQQERVDVGKLAEPEKTDFLTRIRAAYKAGEIIFVENATQFMRGQHDGIIHGSELCLRGETFRKLFPRVLIEDVARSLLSQGALRKGTDKLQIQISGTGGLRFYAIPLTKMQ